MGEVAGGEITEEAKEKMGETKKPSNQWRALLCDICGKKAGYFNPCYINRSKITSVRCENCLKASMEVKQ